MAPAEKLHRVMDRLSRILGFLLIGAGILFNEAVIRFLSRGEVRFAELEKRIFLVILEIFLIALGYLLIRYKNAALKNLLLVMFSFLASFGMIEIGLRFIPSNLEAERPLWIPSELKIGNRALKEAHLKVARMNPYGFNDRVHRMEKAPGVRRIAVLGDSVIWGEGVREEAIWTRRLEEKLNRGGAAAEILNWGKPGWSTLDQFHFLASEGIKYDFDLLIFAFVINDPVMDESQPRLFIYEGGLAESLVNNTIGYLFPDAASLFIDLINNFFNGYFGYGYENWLKKVYETDNLNRYQALLLKIGDYCRSRRIPVIFVLTPENYLPYLKDAFGKIEVMLEAAGIRYLNLYPEIHRRFHHLPVRRLWANPADAHPGDLLTRAYAEMVAEYLADKRELQVKIRKKQKDLR